MYALSEYDIDILMKILHSERIASKFNTDYSIGTTVCSDYIDYLVFNDRNEPRSFEICDKGRFINMFTNKTIESKENLKINLSANDAAWLRKYK